MAILISGQVVIDETSGTQNPDDGSDAAGNDIDGGLGLLPDDLDTALASLSLTVDSTTTVAVSGADADNSTGAAMITGLPADLTDVSWSDSTGAPLVGVDSGLDTTDGTSVLLYTYTGDNNVLLGRKGGATGDIVFVAYLDTLTAAAGDAGATQAKVWLVQFETMFNDLAGSSAAAHDDPVSPDNVIYVAVSQLLTFSLEGAPSGQNTFLMYGEPDDGDDTNGLEVALVVTAADPTNFSVNTGQGGGGTTIGSENQMLDGGEGLIFTFVTNANADYTVPNLTQTEADDPSLILFEGVKDATAASFKVVQTQPASKAGTLTFEAFTTDAEPGAAYVPGIGDADDVHVDIQSVVIKDAAGTVIETNGDTDDDNLTINLVGGVATIIGVKAGYKIEYTTAGDHNRVQIDNSATGHGQNAADFDIGDFQIISPLVTPTLFSAMVFEDDGPEVDFGNIVGTGTETAQVGYWSMDPGADGLGADALDISLDAAVLVRADDSTDAVTSFTFDELVGSPDLDGSYLFAGTLTADFDDDPNTADTDRDFTLTAFDDGHYELVMEQAFGSVVIIDTADGALGAGGPDAVQTLTIPEPPATPITDVVFFSAKIAASDVQILTVIGQGEPDPTETQIETTPALFQYVDSANGREMNVSTSGIGIGNNLLEGDAAAAIGGTDESFVVNPEILVNSVEVFIDNSVGGYEFTDGELLKYRVFYEDGSSTAYSDVQTDLGLTNKGQEDSFFIDGGGQLIDAVQLTMASGDIKIPNIVFVQETEVLASDIKLDFTAKVTDGDGDTATDSFSADLYANELSGSFDFVLTGTALEQDSFNVDLSSDLNTYQVTAGFEVGSDKLVLIGDATATVQSINIGGTDTIVTIAETGGAQTTTVTVVGVDLTSADIAFG